MKVRVCMCVYLYAHTHSNCICIQLLQSWWPRHMTICGFKLLGYSLAVLACVSWCFPKQIPGRFRVSTGQGSLPGCRYFGCGGVRGWRWCNFSKRRLPALSCHAAWPQGPRTVQTEPNWACLSKSRMKRVFKSSAERTNAGTLYYHQLYCNSLLEQWWISTVNRNFEKQPFIFSSSTAKWVKLLHYSYFMSENNLFPFLETSNKIK